MSKRVKLNLEKDKYIDMLNIENDEMPAKDFLGCGICENIHPDIEYFYCVFPNRIDIFRTGYYVNIDKWNKIDSISLKNKKR